MEAVSFTAARTDPTGSWDVLWPALSAFPWPERPFRVKTGGAVGGDARVGRIMARMFGDCVHEVIVPANRALVDYWWREPEFAGLLSAGRLIVTPMPAGSQYRDRNYRLVREGSKLLGFPGYREHDSRSRVSGSWQTLRMARDAGKPHWWWTLDGKERWGAECIVDREHAMTECNGPHLSLADA